MRNRKAAYRNRRWVNKMSRRERRGVSHDVSMKSAIAYNKGAR